MAKAEHIIVTRFSAMGDVAMTVPVIKALLAQHPQVSITMVSNAFFAPLFTNIARCHFFPVHLQQEHRGISGMWRVKNDLLQRRKYDAVADLHDVLRTKMLRKFLGLYGLRSAHINKGRKEKKLLTAKEHKILRPLKTTHQRYADVFAKLGYAVTLQGTTSTTILPAAQHSLLAAHKFKLGIAPFAKHEEKMYPLQKMEELIQSLAGQKGVQLVFFGAAGKEAQVLANWEQRFEGSVNIAGKFSFAQELDIISGLDAMISMDSGNMHLASVYAVPVVSIWGATHPFAGFAGFGQHEDLIVQADLYCRPCSVFGNIPCYRGDHACMHLVSKEQILQKIEQLMEQLKQVSH